MVFRNKKKFIENRPFKWHLWDSFVNEIFLGGFQGCRGFVKFKDGVVVDQRHRHLVQLLVRDLQYSLNQGGVYVQCFIKLKSLPMPNWQPSLNIYYIYDSRQYIHILFSFLFSFFSLFHFSPFSPLITFGLEKLPKRSELCQTNQFCPRIILWPQRFFSICCFFQTNIFTSPLKFISILF